MNHENLPAEFTIHYQGAELAVKTKCDTFKQFVIQLTGGNKTEVFPVTDKLGKCWHEAFKGETSLAKELGSAIEASLSIMQQVNAILKPENRVLQLPQSKTSSRILLHR